MTHASIQSEPMKKPDELLDEVFKKAGGQKALARALRLTKQAVNRWRLNGLVPPKHVRAVSAITGISMVRLRPDLYDFSEPVKLPRTNSHAARA